MVKEFLKSVNIWRSYGQKIVSRFFDSRCTIVKSLHFTRGVCFACTGAVPVGLCAYVHRTTFPIRWLWLPSDDRSFITHTHSLSLSSTLSLLSKLTTGEAHCSAVPYRLVYNWQHCTIIDLTARPILLPSFAEFALTVTWHIAPAMQSTVVTHMWPQPHRKL